MIYDDRETHLTDDERLADRLSETPAQRHERVTSKTVDAETAAVVRRLVAPSRRSTGVSRPCDQCKSTRRCRMHVDSSIAPPVIVYLCGSCERELGFNEERRREAHDVR